MGGSKDKGLVVEGLKTAITIVVATAGASWAARSKLADVETRVTIVETKQSADDANLAAALSNLQTDVREIRAAVLKSDK